MIQRIQTIYIILGILLFVAFIIFEYELIVILIPFMVLIGFTFVSLITSIFLYKKRMLQIRLCGFNIGLLLGVAGMTYFLGLEAAKNCGISYSLTFTLIFPVIAVILILLAMRFIWKDEVLVKTMDRIR